MSPLRGMSGMGGGASSSFSISTSEPESEPAAEPAFNWRYHAYGQSVNEIRVYWRTTDGTMNLLRTITGQQHTSSTATWDTYSEDLSSYDGTTGRIYIAYETGDDYYQDIAFDNMELVDTTSGTINLDPGTAAGRTRWERGFTYVTSGATDIPSTWSSLTIGTSTSNMWNYDSGGTPSGSTGPSLDADGSSTGYYLYFEGSSPNFSTSTQYYWFRMKNDVTLGNPEPFDGDITSSFYEISNRFIESDTYMGGTSDYTGPYDVGQVQQTNFTGTGRVYIGVKVTPATDTYVADIPIAGVQIISGSTLVASWIFNSSTGGSGSGWQTYTSQITGTYVRGFPVTPATASGYSYVNITTATGTGRFTWTSATGSNNTGAANGIANTYKLSADGGSGTLATVGDGQISQSSVTYYAYRETSSSTRYSGAVMRSPEYTFTGNEYIRVIHALTGYSLDPMDPDDSLYVAVY